MRGLSLTVLGLLVASCGADASAPSDGADGPQPGAPTDGQGATEPPAGTTTAPPPGPPGPPPKLSFVAVTFNTGTTDGLDHDAPPDDGYTKDTAKISNDYYGDGLAWNAAIADVKAFFAQLQPDVVTFQEIFHPDACPDIPADKRTGFICETWKPGDATVAQAVVGAGYQVACHTGKADDKCAAVKTSFGHFRNCSQALCLDGLDGAVIDGCGGAARIGRAVVDLVAGGSFTLVNVHGTSGFKSADVDCRRKQVAQVFVNLDGAAAANGGRNVVLGDLNTDPGRLDNIDKSAERWKDFVGGQKTFHWLSDIGSNAAPTYGTEILGGVFNQGLNIDHVMSDVFTGSCWTAGVTAGHPAVTSMRYFDHKPLVCTLTEP